MHVNTGNTREEKNVNCALCTAAALTNQSSGDVNADLQAACPPDERWGPFETDQAFVHYVGSVIPTQRVNVKSSALQPVADQMVGIAHYVHNKLQTNAAFFGNPINRTRADTALPYMNKQPDGTKFAVFTSDGDSIYGDEAHWICAKKESGQITFSDYQPDLQGKAKAAPVHSPHPLRPGGKPYTTRDGETNLQTYMIVIAFGQNLVK